MKRPPARWEIKTSDSATVENLAEALGISRNTAVLLANREIRTVEEARSFLYGVLRELPDPFLLKGMREAVERIMHAIKNNEKILVYGDYDVDGVTSVSTMLLFFRNIPYPLEYMIPRRLTEGYGLNRENIDAIKEKGVDLLITVDNGIADIEEVAYARGLGMDVIIIDHHLPQDELPSDCIIVDPRQPDCSFPDKNMAAVGLSFMLTAALRRTLCENGIMSHGRDVKLKELLDIVTLGTIADLVPLTGINRLFVRFGLPMLERTTRSGLLALKEVSGLEEGRSLGHYEVAFQLAPRINAGGRLGNAEIGVRLIGTDDLEEARDIASKLNRENSARRQIGERMFNQALELIEPIEDYPALVVSHRDWHEGVIGIVASRIVEMYHKPSLVIAEGENGASKGSCRSINGLHMQKALGKCSDLLLRHGGHAMAAGFSIEKSLIDEFRRRFCEIAKAELTEEDYRPLITMDARVEIADLDEKFINELAMLEPFGAGNPAPLFMLEDAEICSARLMKQKHWRLVLRQDDNSAEAVGFNMDYLRFKVGEHIDAAFIPEYNDFAGHRRIQLRLKDVHRRS